MEHAKSYRDENDGSRVRVAFCSICGKEGLQLITEPNCPGEFVDNLSSNTLDNKSEQK